MAVTPEDLLAPVGPLDPTLFPGEGSKVLRARVLAYINGATQEPAVLAAPSERQDGMVKAHALFQAFTAVYIRMSAQPMTVTVTEKGGHGYTVAQITNMKDLAAGYLADFKALSVTAGVAPVTRAGTMSVATDVRW